MEIRGHIGIGPAVEGIALAAADNFSTRYDLDRDRGIVSRPSHKLFGEAFLVLNFVEHFLFLQNNFQ